MIAKREREAVHTIVVLELDDMVRTLIHFIQDLSVTF